MTLTMRNDLATVNLTALTANTEAHLEFDQRDDHVVFCVVAESATDLTVKAGNGIQGVCDMTLTVPKGTSLFKLESGFYKIMSGENKGKVAVVSTGTPKIGAVALV